MRPPKKGRISPGQRTTSWSLINSNKDYSQSLHWVCRCGQTLSPICKWKQRDSQGSPDPNTWPMPTIRSLPVKEAGPFGGWMVTLPLHSSSCGPNDQGCWQTDLGQSLTIPTPNALEGVLKHSPDQWLCNARITHYQTLLLNPTTVTFRYLQLWIQLLCCLILTWKCHCMTVSETWPRHTALGQTCRTHHCPMQTLYGILTAAVSCSTAEGMQVRQSPLKRK